MIKKEEVKVEVIEAPEGCKYVSQFMGTLPLGVLDKVNTGCGATTLAIENDENVVICCPTIRLVTNKVAQYPNGRCEYKLLGVMGGVSKRDIEAYLKSCEGKQPVKILVTYDSFPKVSEMLGKNIHHFKIIVDEFQEITNGAFYRNKAMHSLLENLRGLENITFLSATPIPHQFLPKEIADLKHYRIDWGKQKEAIRILPIESSSPFSTAINMIIEHKAEGQFKLDGQKVDNLFFFVNSVSAISSIIKKTGLKDDDVNIICAESIKNDETLDGFSVGEIPLEGQAHKPFTFCTKTAFCGADFHTENGFCVVVSDNRHTSTVLDIGIDIKQIAGRIRTESNPFKGVVMHIYDTRGEDGEDFYTELEKTIQKSTELVESYRNGDDTLKHVLKEYSEMKSTDEDLFLHFDEAENIMRLDKLKIDSIVYLYENVKLSYEDSQSIEEYYKQQGYSVEKVERIAKELEVFSRTISKAPTLRRLCTEYYQLRSLDKKEVEVNNIAKGNTDRILELEDMQELLPEFYEHMTLEEIDKMRFNITDMKDELYFRKQDTQEAIKAEIRKIFQEGERYSNRVVKLEQQRVYDSLGIRKKATAKGLNQFAEIEEKVKINVGERRVDGIQINKILFIRNTIPRALRELFYRKMS